jgi:YfiH family protein
VSAGLGSMPAPGGAPRLDDGLSILPAGWLQPQFSSPRVAALMTTRDGGVSAAAFASMNLRDGLGDDAVAVQHNRQRLQQALGLPTVLLQQVHGVHVVDLAPALLQGAPPVADASVCVQPGLACEIQVADCLPVLLADVHGRGVAAAHAGWRGLAGGVIEAALARLCQASGARPADVEAWLGPCIGPQSFEVGADVLAAFAADAAAPGLRFRPHVAGKWLADLPGLARHRLQRAGLLRIAGNDGSDAWCTCSNPQRFFSFRRDRITGRMAACIGLRPVPTDPALPA